MWVYKSEIVLLPFKIRVSPWCAPPRYSGEKTLSLLLLHFRASLHSLAYVFFPPSKPAIALFHFLLPCHISPDSSSSSSNYKDLARLHLSIAAPATLLEAGIKSAGSKLTFFSIRLFLSQISSWEFCWKSFHPVLKERKQDKTKPPKLSEPDCSWQTWVF